MSKFQKYLEECESLITSAEAVRIQGDAYTDFVFDNLTIDQYMTIYWLCESRMNLIYQ